MGFINNLELSSSYLTSINVLTPIPTDLDGLIFKLIKSPSFKSWDVDTPTVAWILWTFPVTWSKLLFKEYSKLLEPIFVSPTNDKPSVFVVNPTCVTIPIKFCDLLIIKTSWLSPDSGILKVDTPLSSETVNAYPAVGFVSVTLWFVTNGWSGILILCSGVDTTLIKSPKVDVEVEPRPTAVPTPIVSCGLKNISSFNFELISVNPRPVVFCNANVFGINSNTVPTVWTPDDAPLLTLNILFWSNLFKTRSFSVPIPILLPTDIWSGIFVT